jgi:tetratricopeptide (TPR) repeat protein
VADQRYAVARLGEIPAEPERPEWIPVRRHFGIQAFGVNAWTACEDDEAIIPVHDEASIGHEELYLVLNGQATFTVGDEEINGPKGTIVFVRDPAVQRGARARKGTTVLTIGAKPGEAFRISPWEHNARVFPLFDRGEFAEAKQLLEGLVADEPDNAGLLYNLACAEAQLGERDAALQHITRAVEINPSFAAHLREDDDLAPIRDDPRFPG